MTAYLIPSDESLVEEIAKSIAKNRLYRDADIALTDMIGAHGEIEGQLEESIELIFQDLWNGQTDHDKAQREIYRNDALAAIRTINLKLITSTY